MISLVQIIFREQGIARNNLQRFSRARKGLREYGQSDDWRLPDCDTPLSGKSFLPAHHLRGVTTWKVLPRRCGSRMQRVAEMLLRRWAARRKLLNHRHALFFFFGQLSSFSFSRLALPVHYTIQAL